MNSPLKKHGGYHAGHPWYYLLGGDIPKPKQILNLVRMGDYRGYAEADINAADNKGYAEANDGIAEFPEEIQGRFQARHLTLLRNCQGIMQGAGTTARAVSMLP